MSPSYSLIGSAKRDFANQGIEPRGMTQSPFKRNGSALPEHPRTFNVPSALSMRNDQINLDSINVQKRSSI